MIDVLRLKPLFWVGPSLKDLRSFPEEVKDVIGFALWTENGFRSSWSKARDKAGLAGLTFHDLRGTAVTRLKLAGCNEAETALYTGLSLTDVSAILERHYFHRDPRLAESAVAKLFAELTEAGTNSPKCAPKWPDASTEGTRKAE